MCVTTILLLSAQDNETSKITTVWYIFDDIYWTKIEAYGLHSYPLLKSTKPVRCNKFAEYSAKLIVVSKTQYERYDGALGV